MKLPSRRRMARVRTSRWAREHGLGLLANLILPLPKPKPKPVELRGTPVIVYETGRLVEAPQDVILNPCNIEFDVRPSMRTIFYYYPGAYQKYKARGHFATADVQLIRTKDKVIANALTYSVSIAYDYARVEWLKPMFRSLVAKLREHGLKSVALPRELAEKQISWEKALPYLTDVAERNPDIEWHVYDQV